MPGCSVEASSPGWRPGAVGAQRRQGARCWDASRLSAPGGYLMGYLINGKEVLWAGPVASRKGGIYSVRTTFYKNTNVMGPLRPRPRAGLPGGGLSGAGGGPPEKGCSSQRAWEEQWWGVPWRRNLI